MSLLSTPQNTLLLPRAIPNLTSSPLFFLPLTSKPSIPFSLRLRNSTLLSPSLPLPLLPPPRATYDIPIKINDEDYERFLDRQPWKGAVVYKRDATVSHVEYCTSLDRLTIGWLSSRVSADRAAEMGLKLPDDLNWIYDDEGGDNDERINGQDVVFEGKDDNNNSVFLSADELRNAKISLKYGDDDDDDDDDDEFDDFDIDDEIGGEFIDTPVLVSIDVTRKRDSIRLDGIIRTVITLDCKRCFGPSAECVYSNFSLLLSETPIGEPPENEDSIEEMFAESKKKKTKVEILGADGDEDRDIEWDDRFHFPAEQSEIDISKQVRDIIHLGITMNALCGPNCKGICSKCGKNLNLGNCNCVKKVKKGGEQSSGQSMRHGPLRDLRKKLEKSLEQ
ncbi:hypothetical protein LUZ62_060642 [Rhynchospora pubera]|uniref:DUF177 domain-containing protein n=1 Tax=Rhynchospora pubera TaxID=906938 RepID=A0AAV8E9Y6_9POAL|nr:hypothetical protein LUZ62_060642 [Rhynchospora pubera]